MKTVKNGNLVKLVAFFLIATILIIAIVLSASGWQESPNPEPDSGNADTNNGNTDENTDGSGTSGDTTVLAPTHNHINYITGLPVSESESLIKPFAFVCDSKAPLYGISDAYMVIEIPTENGKTRFLAFTNNAMELGKIGSVSPTRKYISSIAKYFGAILVSNGEDDSFNYSAEELTDGHIDFSAVKGYHYTEFQSYCYTNADLIRAYVQNTDLNTVLKSYPKAPYAFTDANLFVGANTAATVLISYSDSASTELIYSATSNKYQLKKNSCEITDLLTDKRPAYDNVFILHADATTYETRDATEMILDTSRGGVGYYASGGYVKEIAWEKAEDGSLIFLGSDGQRLLINPGTSYVSFVKSSEPDSVIFG